MAIPKNKLYLSERIWRQPHLPKTHQQLAVLLLNICPNSIFESSESI